VTLNGDKKTEPAPKKRLNGDSHPTPPRAHSVLDSVCRSATELAKAVPTPPRRIRLQYGQTSVEVEWPQEAQEAQAPPAPGQEPAAPPSAQPAQPAHSAHSAHSAKQTHYLCAPTVGTFYHSPEPGAPPYVAVGDLVRPGQAVGVLEVMKMMSPVEADAAGRVVEILVPDAQPVEYQQRLFVLEPVEGE
jgi:acetyl-CoA carboxylase biotin carboxyl carrier protein